MKYLAQIDFSELESIAAPKLANQGPLTVVSTIVNYFFPLAGFLVLFYLVSGGYLYLTSQGDPKSIAAAQQRITWAIVGFLVLFAAYWITLAVGKFLDIQIINEDFALGGKGGGGK